MAHARDPRAEGAYELAYVEAARALSEQQAVIDNFRTRAGMLVSGATIATSFLGGAAVRGGTTVLAWAAIALFVVVGAEIGAVLWPREEWGYNMNPARLIATYVEVDEPLSLPAIHRELALHMHASWVANANALQRIVKHFRIAAIVLMLEVLCWVGALAGQA